MVVGEGGKRRVVVRRSERDDGRRRGRREKEGRGRVRGRFHALVLFALVGGGDHGGAVGLLAICAEAIRDEERCHVGICFICFPIVRPNDTTCSGR